MSHDVLDNDATEDNFEKQTHEILHLKAQLIKANNENIELYDFNQMIYFTIDHQYSIQRVNFKAANFLNIDRKLLLNQSFLNFVTINSQHKLHKIVQNLLEYECKQMGEIEIIQKNVGKKYVSFEIMLLPNQLMRISLIDITDLCVLQSKFFEINKSLNLLNNVFQQVNDAIAIIDSAYSVKMINHAFVQIFSRVFAIKIQVGMNLNIMLSDFPELKAKIIQASQDALAGNKATILFENITHDHALYYCYELIVDVFYNQHSTQYDLILYIRNLTELKLEERRQHKQQVEIYTASKVSTIGELTSAFAHEISQPLTAIIAYSRSCLIIQNTLKHEKILKKILHPIEQIALQANHACEIIQNMKNFLGDHDFNVEETDINPLIQETLSILSYELLDFKLKITLNLTDNPPKIKVNKIHIMQIILNLARNSIEALQTTPDIKPELIIKTQERNEHMVIHVIDNGPGIPAEFEDKILHSFFTTKPKGAAIGLRVCKSLVEAHGGSINIQKHTKNGAWFTFTLPIAERIS
ncbi:MAG: ATP-binding protein [Legionellaceae bacterium]|nr:ATP-binding protein [Legionellaceae bacterium]